MALLSSIEIREDMVEALTTYHKPDADQLKKMERVSAAAAIFLKEIIENCPPCVDTQHALVQARDARMWANTAISLKGMV